MTISAIFLACLAALHGTENRQAHAATESHPKADAAEKGAEPDAQHKETPAVDDHPKVDHPSSAKTENDTEPKSETSKEKTDEGGGHAVATESDKVHDKGDKKRHGKSHQPQLPERPKGVLCGTLPEGRLNWKAKQGPLTLVGSVVIGPGAELSLEAGTEIKVGGFDSCPDSGSTASNGRSIALIVRGGTLHIDGKPGKPVRFTPMSTGNGYLWNGIRIEKAVRNDQAQIRWAEIARATKGVAFLASAGRLEHVVIEECGIGVASLLGSSPDITHSVISGSAITAIASNRSATKLVSSLILGGGDGVRFDGIGLSSISTNCFWGQSGTEIVRGPARLGGWRGDSVPDPFGNWHRDPILRNTPEHERKLAEAQHAMEQQPWWKPRKLPNAPVGRGKWALSSFSPLIDKGEAHFCSDLDGSPCDIGLWGGR